MNIKYIEKEILNILKNQEGWFDLCYSLDDFDLYKKKSLWDWGIGFCDNGDLSLFYSFIGDKFRENISDFYLKFKHYRAEKDSFAKIAKRIYKIKRKESREIRRAHNLYYGKIKITKV